MEQIKIRCSNPLCVNEILIPVNKKGRIDKYCSKNCKKKSKYEGISATWDSLNKEWLLVCIRCKKEYKSRRIKKYCSKTCSYRERYVIKKQKNKVDKKCVYPFCNNLISTTGNKKYCSLECKQKAYYVRVGYTEKNFRKIRQKTQMFAPLFFAYKNNKCERCNSQDSLLIHHKRYTLDFNDWELLCAKCHKVAHNDKGVCNDKEKQS